MNSSEDARRRRAGIAYAAAAYALWGVLPLYLALLAHVPALEVLLHRVLWSAAFVAALLTALRSWPAILGALRRPRAIALGGAAALVLAVNWFVFIWAVERHRVLDASLGYFINPLVSVLLGVALLGERLRRAQWLAISLAGLGVVWLTFDVGRPPWIALVLALSFGIYGLLRKTTALGALEGLALETFLLAPLACAGLVWLVASGGSRFVAGGPGTRALLVLAGPATAVPLLLFAAGARRIPLSLLGLLQYIGPSLQLVVGIFVFGEPFGARRLVGFALIWLALGAYSAEAWWRAGATSRRTHAR